MVYTDDVQFTQMYSSHRCAVYTDVQFTQLAHGYFPGFPLKSLKHSPSPQADWRMAPESLDPRHLKQPLGSVWSDVSYADAEQG